MKTLIAAFLLIAASSPAFAQSAPLQESDPSQCTTQRFEPLLAEAIKAKSVFDAMAKIPPKQRTDAFMVAADLASAKANLAAALDECGLSLRASKGSVIEAP